MTFLVEVIFEVPPPQEPGGPTYARQIRVAVRKDGSCILRERATSAPVDMWGPPVDGQAMSA